MFLEHVPPSLLTQMSFSLQMKSDKNPGPEYRGGGQMSSDNFKQGEGHMNSFTWWRDRAKSCPRIDNLFWEELPVTRHLCSIGKRACLPVHSDTDALVLTTAFFFFNHQLILNHQLVLNHQSRKRDLIVLSFLQMVEITV